MRVLFVLLLCLSHSAFAEKAKLTLTGSSTVAPLALEISKAFEMKNPNVRLEVQTGGSTRGVVEARQGVADIGMISRDLNKTESDLSSHPIAKDGIALIVHKKNKIQNLSNQQIIKIFKKKITNWKQLGGANKKIVVVNKAEGRSTLELFLKYFNLKSSQVRPDIIIGDNEQGVKTVSGNPNAIGYVSIGTAEYDVALGVPIKLLPLEGVPASIENVKNGSYPLSRTLNFVTKDQPTGTKEAFIRFAQSNGVHKIIKQLSFVPIKN